MQFLVINLQLVILLSRIFSNNLENADSREIGRNSSSEVGDVFFGTGMTLATLKSFGKVSNSTHLLNNRARSGAKTHLESFTNLEKFGQGQKQRRVLICLYNHSRLLIIFPQA